MCLQLPMICFGPRSRSTPSVKFNLRFFSCRHRSLLCQQQISIPDRARCTAHFLRNLRRTTGYQLSSSDPPCAQQSDGAGQTTTGPSTAMSIRYSGLISTLRNFTTPLSYGILPQSNAAVTVTPSAMATASRVVALDSVTTVKVTGISRYFRANAPYYVVLVEKDGISV